MPSARDGWRLALALGALVAVSGCSPPTEAPYRSWLPRESASAGSGYALYKECGLRAERLAGRDSRRVHFTPSQRARIGAALAPVVDRIVSRRPADFRLGFDPKPSFDLDALRAGWLMIGQVLVWRSQSRFASGDPDVGIRDLGHAMRFGFDLCGGSAVDADLGLSIVDMARLVAARELGQFDRAQLQRLFDVTRTALEAAPQMEATVANERWMMLAAVEEVQAAFRSNQLSKLSERLGTSVADAVRYLEKLRNERQERRAAYFEGFAREAEAQAKHLSSLAGLNARQRSEAKRPELALERPWRRFARHYFHSADPLFAMRDRTLARTRLLAIHAFVLNAIKATGAAPANLNGLPRALTVDPCSGAPLVFRADGSEFRLYSVGADFRDDGGDSDEASNAPDLLLEN